MNRPGSLFCVCMLSLVVTVNMIHAKEPAQKAKSVAKVLFDGETLNGWSVPEFGGEGKVSVTNGCLRLGMGYGCTGVAFTNAIPRVNYEISLDAMRVKGNDFFCGLTFPVKTDPCTLIVGGWGGGLVGLSSLDMMDASENNTSSWEKFENGKWYHIRVRVTDEKIEAWIDDKKLVDVIHTEYQVGIRIEVDPCKPLGFASWMTTADLKHIRVKRLK